jgi:SAM-dependent methyltransferase/glycosyltransferase involved in cell wall biosynthesis
MKAITEKTTREEVLKEYVSYPDTAPEGFQPFHMSRVMPIYWDIENGSSVLDVGCNSGEFMKMLLDGNRGISVKGVDVSEVAIESARKKGLDVSLGDGELLPYPDNSFDYVVLMEVLSHVHDPKKVLQEVKRVLKQDGVLLGSCPHKNLEMIMWDDKRMHRSYYATNELVDLLYDVFPAVFSKVLNGTQFSLGMAQTAMANKDAEIIFKAGNSSLKPWDYKLLDKETLRVWMGPTQNAGDVYYRMSGFAEKMNTDKCDVLYSRFAPFGEPNPGDWQNALQRIQGNQPANKVVVKQLEQMIKMADMTVWQITASWSVLAFFQCLKEVYKNKPFITECDDWLFDIPSYNIASHPYKPGSEAQQIAYKQLEMSDAIIVSTQFIKDSFQTLFPRKKIIVVPNGIDFDLWDKLKRPEKDGKIRIGYTGCQNHHEDLRIVKKPILALLEEFPNLEFIMAAPFTSWEDVKHERVLVNTTWAPIDVYPKMVSEWNLDIGIAPLKDSNFNRAKSNLRWLEYSALEIPTVASSIYPFKNSIKDGVDGYICSTSQEWYERLKTLITDRVKRSRMGVEAYTRVKKDFSMGKIAQDYRGILNRIKKEFPDGFIRNLG